MHPAHLGIRALLGGIALACGALTLWLCGRHPLGPGVATGLAVVLAMGCGLAPSRWPTWVLGGLPLAGLMTWTGWLLVEEFDLLLLSCVCGASGRWALLGITGHATVPSRDRVGLLRLCLVVGLWVLFAASVSLSLIRGFEAFGGWAALGAQPPQAWWWHGYREPLASLRLAKPGVNLMLALVLVGLALRHGGRLGTDLLDAVRTGMVVMLLITGALALWERVAHTSLTDFSSDYRTSALFWEMHVGGAALDVTLAIGMPFALLQLLRPPSRHAWLVAAVALSLGGYAAITAFSRILYAAIPMVLVVTWWVVRRQAAGQNPSSRPVMEAGGSTTTNVVGGGMAWPLAWWLLAAGGATLLFGSSGWRGLLAWAGVLTLAWGAAQAVPGTRGFGWAWRALLVALPLVLLAWLAEATVPKGVYIAFAAFTLAGVGIGRAVADRRVPAWASVSLLWAGSAAMIMVCGHWGGDAAAYAAAPLAALAAVVPLAVTVVAGWRPPDGSTKSLIQVNLVAGLVMLLVGVFHGGAYMGDRLQSASGDWAGRLQHWAGALRLMRGPMDEWLGMGLGRFVPEHQFTGVADHVTGQHRWVATQAPPHLALTSGRYSLSWGDMLRVSQRVAPPVGRVTVKLRVRSEHAFLLHMDLCEKQLLYTSACQYGRVGPAGARARPGEWLELKATLSGDVAQRGAWYAPRLIVFSIALESSAHAVDIQSVEAIDESGRQLLSNTRFEAGLAHWYMSSDRHHMPWHMKNLALHVFFEQGWLGAVSLALLVVAAGWNLLVGGGRSHPMAAPLLGAWLGVLIVGAIDSVWNMPRIAFAHGLVLMVAMLLPAADSAADAAPSERSP